MGGSGGTEDSEAGSVPIRKRGIEEHPPVVRVKKDVVQARVGVNDPLMDEEHYITWVFLETTRGGSLRVLRPGDPPQVEFRLSDGERPLAVYEYCNRHGLWRAELAQA